MARVLVIDDEEMMRRLLVRVLTHLGHDVETASDGEEGLNKFHEGEFDTVLTDLLMPTRDGMETIHELRRTAPGLRIVAMSGSFHPLSDEVRIAKAVGANCVLEKPFGMKDVANALAI